jgi:drug/metabolite transporter (DMT)-like permease
VAIVLALAAATSWGSSDFVAGLLGRRCSALSIVVGAHLAGLAGILALLPFLPGDASAGNLLWGAAAGLSGGVGAALLYRGLAIGRMGVVASMTAAGAACLPALVEFVGGGRASPTVLLGALLALVAIVVLSVPNGHVAAASPPRPGRLAVSSVRRWLAQPGLSEALLAGVGFAGFFVGLERTTQDAGLWPLFGARLASVTVLGAVALLRGHTILPARRARVGVGVVGLLDATAGALYLLATRHGVLSVVAVLSSLYPGATVLLARVFEGERSHPVHRFGLLVAAAGVSLMARG